MKCVVNVFINNFFFFCWCVLSLFVWLSTAWSKKRVYSRGRGFNSIRGSCFFITLGSVKCFISEGRYFLGMIDPYGF